MGKSWADLTAFAVGLASALSLFHAAPAIGLSCDPLDPGTFQGSAMRVRVNGTELTLDGNEGFEGWPFMPTFTLSAEQLDPMPFSINGRPDGDVLLELR